MIRGIKIFRCKDCGRIFLAPDIEYGATTFSQAMPCPICGRSCTPIFKDKVFRNHRIC